MALGLRLSDSRGTLVEAMTEINKLIEQTELLLAAATQGEWSVHGGYGGDVWIAITDGQTRDATEADLDIMNYAPTALRVLIDEVHRLRQQVAQLEFDATTQPNADWQPSSKTAVEVRP